jgi:hypothetical protein
MRRRSVERLRQGNPIIPFFLSLGMGPKSNMAFSPSCAMMAHFCPGNDGPFNTLGQVHRLKSALVDCIPYLCLHLEEPAQSGLLGVPNFYVRSGQE